MSDLPKHWFWLYKHGKRDWGRGLQYAQDVIAQIYSTGTPFRPVTYKRASLHSVILWVGGARYIWAARRGWGKLNTDQRINVLGVVLSNAIAITALVVALRS